MEQFPLPLTLVEELVRSQPDFQRHLIEALERVKNSFNSYPLDRLAVAGRWLLTKAPRISRKRVSP